MNILNTTSSFDSSGAIGKILEGYRLVLVKNPFKRSLTEEEVISLITEFRPAGILAGTENLSRKVLQSGCPELKVISRIGVGWDKVDHKSAEEFGIAVYRTPDGPTAAVTELTVGLMLAVLRKIAFADRKIRNGQWEKMMGGLLGQRTVGLIGFGRIGKSVAKTLINGFGSRVIVYDPFLDVVNESGCQRVSSVEELLEKSGIISLHLPGGNENRHIIGKKELAIVKKGSIIINTSRGDLVDEAALVEALNNGRLSGAGLDVFEKEPYNDGPLMGLDSVVMTAHMGSYAEEARVKMENDAVQNLISGLKEKGTLGQTG